MLDLHCHILPAVDDGPRTIDEALAVARLCVADGITHVVATPHCHRHIRMVRTHVLPAVARFRRSLEEAQIPLTVLPGSEIQVFDSATYRNEFEAGVYCHLGDRSTYTLLEFPWDPRFYPADAAELVGWLKARGTTPIIAHPERYKFFRDDPAKLRALVDAGAWFQLTVDSLLGNHGPMAEAFGAELLEELPDVVLATDTHNTERCSGLSPGYAWVRERHGAGWEADLRGRAERILASLLDGQGSDEPEA